MDNDKQKPTAWNFESQDISNTPELQSQKAVNWSAVGDSMSRDVNQNFTTRWYFNTPFVFAALLLSAFVSRILGIILIVIMMSRVIMVTIQSNRSPSKTGSIIGWLFVTVVFIGLALVI